MLNKLTLALGAGLIAVLSALVYFTYDGIKERGRAEAIAECDAKFKDYTKDLEERIKAMEEGISIIADNSATKQDIMAGDIEEILKRLRKGPITIVKDGKCIPSPTFVDGINEAISRANSK